VLGVTLIWASPRLATCSHAGAASNTSAAAARMDLSFMIAIVLIYLCCFVAFIAFKYKYSYGINQKKAQPLAELRLNE
jgi:Ca2+/Na+ antiporter